MGPSQDAEELRDGRPSVFAAGDRPQTPQKQPLRERLGVLRNLRPFLKLVWQTSPALTLSQGVLRILRALLPVTLYVGKLIIAEVVLLAGAPSANDTLIKPARRQAAAA